MGFTKNTNKYLFSAFFVSLALSLSACNNSSNNSNSGTDEPVVIANLAVTSTAPADKATGVGVNSKVVAVFNKQVSIDSLDQAFTLQGDSGPALSSVVDYNASTKTATFTPVGDLSEDTVYTATLTTDVQSETGDSLVKNVVWTFTTAALPNSEDTTAPTLNVDATTPKQGDTDVLLNINLNIVFSEAIDPATVTAETIKLTEEGVAEAVAGTLSYVNPTTVVFTPDTNLAAVKLHTLTLSNAIADLAGNTLAVTTLTFTTGSDVFAGPAAVNLGTAGNYVLLAKTAISTTGITHILGDIAVSPAARSFLTGFDETLDSDTGTFATSDLVTGKLFAANMTPDTPVILTTAVSDMQIAYTDAAGRSNPDETEVGAGQIGGMTLEPGLYKWGTGVLVSSDVTLNGGANDVWIFQIAEGLKLEDGVSILLTGGALPKNVFWQVAEGVTLQAGSTFNGIILGQTGVEMLSGATLNGRALVQTAVTLIANDVNQPAE